MQLAIRRASSWRSEGNNGSRSLMRMSRASASSAAPSGRSRIFRRSAIIEQHQDFELAFAGAPPRQREIEAALTAEQAAVALLQRDHRPAHTRQNFPIMDATRVDPPADFALVAPVERHTVADAAGF